MKIIRSSEKDSMEKTVNLMSSQIRDVLKKKEKAIIGLPGGNSIKSVLIRLREEDLPWYCIHIFLTDERFVELDDENSNFKLLKDYLFDHIDIPEENIHPFDYNRGVESYTKEFGEQGGEFDLLILGAGEDCHVGSLFPKNKVLDNDKREYVFVDDSPKPPSQRVSISKELIKDASMCIVLFLGEKKRKAIDDFFTGNKSEKECPAKFARKSGDCYVITDL